LKKSVRIMCIVFLSFLFSCIAIEALSLSQMQKSFDEDLYKNVIRLHVLANSDSEYDQKAKIAIKDYVVAHISSYTENAANVGDAVAMIEKNLSNIESFTKKASKDLGYDYDVKIDFSEERYPVRYYDGFSFPAGKYRSLRIMLGKGEGKNWWCVLYPSICNKASEKVPEMLESAGVSKKTASYICDDEKYKIRFRLLELFGF